jgi:polyhydroxyalkanoate synthesis regulator phasin
MSDEKNKVTDKASEIAKNIWLAGVGAYGKAVEDAQGRLEKAMEPPKLFKDLVKAGAALEEDAREALEGTSAARHSVEERIGRVRDNFHMQRPARMEDIAALEKKVAQLSRKVDKLSKALAEQGGPAKPARKKPVAATVKKAATKKAPAKKKKAPARKKSSSAKTKKA